jgi:hypothetical protein
LKADAEEYVVEEEEADRGLSLLSIGSYSGRWIFAVVDTDG